MGATSAYVYGSVHTKDALDKIKIFINLAPPMFIQHASLSFVFVSRIWPLVKVSVFKANQTVIKKYIFSCH